MTLSVAEGYPFKFFHVQKTPNPDRQLSNLEVERSESPTCVKYLFPNGTKLKLNIPLSKV